MGPTIVKTENLLLSSARSGTNFFLAVYGKCYPQDFVVREIFRPKFDSLPKLVSLLKLPEEEIKRLVEQDPVGLWRQITARCAETERHALAKIFYIHAEPEAELWQHFRETTKIVHLIRRNQFDAFLSQKIARQTGKWQRLRGSEDSERPPKVKLWPGATKRFLDQQQAHVDWARDTFGAADYTEVFYEDIAASAEVCAEAIQRIYGRPAAATDFDIWLRKQKTVTNAELVENYEDVQHLDCPIF